MKKMMCPYCDHEMKKAGRCEFCGSRVRKPLMVETTAVFDTKPSAQPGECDCRIHSEASHQHDDTYRDSADKSFERDYRKAYTSERKGNAGSLNSGGNKANTGTAFPEAKNTWGNGGFRNLPGLAKAIIIYILLNIIISFITVFVAGL